MVLSLSVLRLHLTSSAKMVDSADVTLTKCFSTLSFGLCRNVNVTHQTKGEGQHFVIFLGGGVGGSTR